MRLPVVLRSLCWVLTLPLGSALLIFIDPWFHQPNDDSGFGVFYGFVSGRFYGSRPCSCLHFEGRTERAWMWGAPSNYVYRALDIDWVSREGNEGHGHLLLPSMSLMAGGKQTPCTEDWLKDLMIVSTDEAADPSLTADLHCLHELIRAAGVGNLPAPRHHSYQFGKAITGDLVHFSLGWRLPYSLYWWAGLWVGLSAFLVRRFLRQPRRSRVPLRHT